MLSGGVAAVNAAWPALPGGLRRVPLADDDTPVDGDWRPYTASTMPRHNLYPTRLGLQESFVVWLDVLGYSDMCRAATTRADQNALLSRLRQALRRHRPLLQPTREPPFVALRAFTDNIVLGRPLFTGPLEDGESELAYMMMASAAYQFALARSGFFVRGAIAVGDHYMDEYMVFGPALIEAHDLESARAKTPRVLLSERAREFVTRHVRSYGDVSDSPHDSELLVDADGEWFLNYLDAARGDDDVELLPAYRPFFMQHREVVASRLTEFATVPPVLAKYEWVAAYHNFVCGYLYPRDAELPLPGVEAGGFRRLSEVLPARGRPRGTARRTGRSQGPSSP